MKKILSVIILLSCIVSSMFALSAVISTSGNHRKIYVYNESKDDKRMRLLVYSRPIVPYTCKQSLRSLYSIEWCYEGATAEEIKEWKEFAKLFVEESLF